MSTAILIFGFIAGLLTIGVSYFQYKQKKEDDKDAADNRNKVDAMQRTIISLQAESLKKSDELQVANSKIISLQTKTINEITGGDTKPVLRLSYFHPSSLPAQPNIFALIFEIKNSGEFNLKNTSAEIFDRWGLEPLFYKKNVS